jgi:hypothetical protein
MPDLVSTVLAAWVLSCVVLFRRWPGRDAALIALIGGWAFLPTGRYPPSVFFEPLGSGGSMHTIALPVAHPLNKATAIALGCLAGAILFDWPALRRFRPGWADLPMLAWCLVPLASAPANGLPPAEGLAQARYLVLSWGVPYLMGRVYLTDPDALRRMALGLVLAGVLYLPLCLVELIRRPFLYGMVYGAHPYQLLGAERFLGYRPMVFLEDGNQLGMWMAVAAVAAAWLWKAGRVPSFAGVPAGVVAVSLVTATFLFQSHAAIVLMLVSLALLLFVGQESAAPRARRRAWMVVVAVLVLGLVVGVSALGVARHSFDPGLRDALRGAFGAVGKGSFTWRLARYEDHFPQIGRRPILGWARPDWSASADHRFIDPIGTSLWLHVLGRYGLLGLVVSSAVPILPVLRVLRRVPRRSWGTPAGSAVSLIAVLLAINLVDSLLNSGWLLPLLAGAGGLNSWLAGQGGTSPSFQGPAWKYDRTTGLFRGAAGP